MDTSTARRSLTLCPRRLAMWPEISGQFTSTRSKVSISAAVTVGQSLGEGGDTNIRRSRATPSSAAEAIPNAGMPIAATQDPAWEGPAVSA
jgi:hypothetical protein